MTGTLPDSAAPFTHCSCHATNLPPRKREALTMDLIRPTFNPIAAFLRSSIAARSVRWDQAAFDDHRPALWGELRSGLAQARIHIAACKDYYFDAREPLRQAARRISDGGASWASGRELKIKPVRHGQPGGGAG